jgi:uncharacterized phiE125 gp8 family phage protein
MTLCPVRLDVDPLAASPLPVDLAALKQHLRVDVPDDDALIGTYLLAAVSWAEGAMHRTIFSRGHRWVLRDFPQDTYQRIRLPRGKTVSVDKIEVDRRDGLLTLRGPSSGSPAGTDYMEDLRGDDGALVMPQAGASWPSAELDRPAPVTVHFTAGWAQADVPQEIVHALMFAVADAYELRGTPDLNGGRTLDAREALISGWRLSRWY